MEQYAYIRVSTKEQHIDRQIMALKPYSISPKNIYCDYQSGKDFERPEYRKLYIYQTESKNRIAFQNSMKIQCHSTGKSNLKKTCVKRLEEMKIFRILESRKYYLKYYLREKLTSCGFFT